MKKKKYLEFYDKHAQSGVLPDCGLCWSFKFNNLPKDELELFKPKEACETDYWADGRNKGEQPIWGAYLDFTPLRQNIVLFLAAMNGEL